MAHTTPLAPRPSPSFPLSATTSIPKSPFPRPAVQVNIIYSPGALLNLRQAPEKKGRDVFLKKGPASSFAANMARLNRPGESPFVRQFVLIPNDPFLNRYAHASLASHGFVERNGPKIEQIYGDDAIHSFLRAEAPHIDLFFSTTDEPGLATEDLTLPIPLALLDPGHIPLEKERRSLCLATDFDGVIAICLGRPGSKDFPFDTDTYVRNTSLREAQKREGFCRNIPADPGPLYPFFAKISLVRQKIQKDPERPSLDIVGVTARHRASFDRVKKTAVEWGLGISRFFSTGDTPKGPVVAETDAILFLDDNENHIASVRENCPGTLAAQVVFPHVHVAALKEMYDLPACRLG